MRLCRLAAPAALALGALTLPGCTACFDKPPVIKVAEVEAIRIDHGTLGWHDLALGMTAAEVSRRLGTKVQPGGVSDSGCEGPMARVKVKDHDADLYFSGEGDEATLNGIFVPLTWRRTKGAVVRSLKHNHPELRYQPSRYQPDLPEDKNPTPVFVVGAQDQKQAILVKPDEKGFWLSYEECLD